MKHDAQRDTNNYEDHLNYLSDLNRRQNAAYRDISDILAKAPDMESGVSKVLEYVGNFLDVSRTYIYEPDPGSSLHVSCTFEWCAPNVIPLKNQLQHLDYKAVGFPLFFEASTSCCITDTTHLPEQTKQKLHLYDRKALIHYGIFDKGVYSGIVGIDDATSTRSDWEATTDEQDILAYVANLLSLYLIKEHNMLHLSRVSRILETQQKDLNEQLASVLGGIKGGLIICKNEPGYPYMYVSQSIAAMQGYTPMELLQVTDELAQNNILEEDRADTTSRMAEQLAASGEHHLKYRIRHKNGHEIWVSDYGRLVSFGERNPLLYCFYQDITEQEMARQQLMTEQHIFRDAIIQNSVLNIIADVTDNCIIDDSLLPDGKRHMSDLGISIPAPLDEVSSMFFKTEQIEILTPGGESYFKSKDIERMYRDGITTDSIELYLSNQKRYFRLRPLLSENPANGHIMCFCSCYNITAEKQAKNMQEQALRDALAAAEQANRAKTIFLSSMSHDIRTPMNAILGYTTLARQHSDDTEKVADYLQKIHESGTHLLNLINDVLDMSRIESGKMILTQKKESLLDIIKETCTIVENDAAEKKICFSCSTEAVRISDIVCDKLRTKQVLINCLNNAVKFTEPGGKVSFTVTQLEDTEAGRGNYRFEVADTGIGMSEKFRQRIFQPFERARTSTVSGIQGTGLGMSICRNIVDCAGGTIAVQSEEGKGTKITIELSFSYSGTDATSETAAATTFDGKTSFASENPTLQGLHILLAEDNVMNREIAMELLEEAGAVVTPVTDGRQAVQVIKDAKPETFNLILMDIQMPEMDGYTATRCIRALSDKSKCSIPIIAMTANAFAEDRRLALETGMNGHISKPVDVSILISEIKRVL